jgi:hypothetical protein
VGRGWMDALVAILQLRELNQVWGVTMSTVFGRSRSEDPIGPSSGRKSPSNTCGSHVSLPIRGDWLMFPGYLDRFRVDSGILQYTFVMVSNDLEVFWKYRFLQYAQNGSSQWGGAIPILSASIPKKASANAMWLKSGQVFSLVLPAFW